MSTKLIAKIRKRKNTKINILRILDKVDRIYFFIRFTLAANACLTLSYALQSISQYKNVSENHRHFIENVGKRRTDNGKMNARRRFYYTLTGWGRRVGGGEVIKITRRKNI